jgi:hypothetical protein
MAKKYKNFKDAWKDGFEGLTIYLTRIEENAVETFKNFWGAIKVAIFSCLMLFVLLFATIHTGNQTMALIMAIASTILFFFVRYIATIASKSLRGINKVPGANLIADELAGLFYPLITTSLIFAFSSFWIGIKGYEMVTTEMALAIYTASLFFLIFLVWAGSKKKVIGYILAGIVIFMLVQKAMPEQYRWVYRSIYSYGQYKGAQADRYSRDKQADARATYSYVIDAGVFYEGDKPALKDGKKIVATVNTKVMILDVKDNRPEEIGDPMEKVILADEYGTFFKSTKPYSYPRAKLGKYMVVSDFNREKVKSPGQKLDWKTVFPPHTYTGHGMGEKDIIPEDLPYFGKDILKGDKIIIKGKKFKFLDSVWGEYENYAETICGVSVEKPDTIGVRAPAGEKITIEVKRFM